MTETTAPVQSLHDQIMRLPCTPPKDANVNQSISYKSGHRDARHAAAELAAEHEAEQQQELTAIEAMARMLADGEWAEHVGMLGGPIAQRLETEITRMHNEQQATQAAVQDELRAKAENFVARMRKGAEGDRAAERELEDEDADEAQACAVQAYIQEDAAAMVEQLLAAAPTPPTRPRISIEDMACAAFEEAMSFGVNLDAFLRLANSVAEVVAPTTTAQQIDQLRHERDALAEAIGKAAARVGLVAPDTPLTGPMLLMLCDDIAECCLSAESAATPAQQSQRVRVTPELRAHAQMLQDDLCADLQEGGAPKLPAWILDVLSSPGDTAAPEQAEQPHPVNRSVIRDVFLRNGFTIKEGHSDLKPYVYAAAEELLALDGKAVAVEQDTVTVPRGLLECYLNGGGDWVEAGHKLRDLLGGGA